jgi:hypothetical protein
LLPVLVLYTESTPYETGSATPDTYTPIHRIHCIASGDFTLTTVDFSMQCVALDIADELMHGWIIRLTTLTVVDLVLVA